MVRLYAHARAKLARHTEVGAGEGIYASEGWGGEKAVDIETSGSNQNPLTHMLPTASSYTVKTSFSSIMKRKENTHVNTINESKRA